VNFQTISSKLDSAVELVLDQECSYVPQNASLHNADVNTLIAGRQDNR